MIVFVKTILKAILLPSLYFGAIGAMLVSVFKNARYGLYLLAFLIPQPNIYYKLHRFPYGNMLVDLTILSILIGIFVQKLNDSYKSSNEKWVICIILYSYLAIWNSSFRYDLPAPFFTSSPLFVNWKNFVRTLLLYFIAFKLAKTEKDQKIVILLITAAILMISLRAYRNFSGGAGFRWDKRLGGPFEACGLGANHFGAFIAAYAAQIVGLSLMDANKTRKKIFIITSLLALHPLLFSYSRGAYLGFFCGMLALGVLRSKKIILALILVVICWQTLLPVSVVDRITMTETEEGELESSSAGRIELWREAIDLFEDSPLFGVGYDGFSIHEKRGDDHIVSGGVVLTDTHNYFVKIVCEQGLIGLTLIILIFIKGAKSGWRLYRIGNTKFSKGLGLGFVSCVGALFIANIFGDRFSYLVSGSYFWILFGMVDRRLAVCEKDVEEPDPEFSPGIIGGIQRKLIHG